MATLRTMPSDEPTRSAGTARVNMKFEIVVIPVSDVDRAKEFYTKLGWRLDADFGSSKDFRVIQFTPPGSGCSIIFGKNVTAAEPGSAQGMYLIVSDIEAALRTVTAGSSRRSRHGCLVASTPPRRISRRWAIWRARCAGQRPPTGNTKSEQGSATRTGRTGMPSTWCASRTAKTCRNKALRRNHHRDGPGG